jgi:hypothetical protein
LDFGTPGFETVIQPVPPLAIRVAVTVAVSCSAETYVVLSAVLSQFTVEGDTKFTPFTVRVKLEPPGAADTGEMLVI